MPNQARIDAASVEVAVVDGGGGTRMGAAGVEVAVIDSGGASRFNAASIEVAVIDPNPPQITLPDTSGQPNQSVTFDASASLVETYRWSWNSVPGGSNVSNLQEPYPDGSASSPIDMTNNELLVHADGNLDDTSGNSRDGTAVNGQSFSAGRVTGQALIFDGSNSVTFGNNLQYTNGDFTYALWMKPTSGQTQPQWQQVFGVYGGNHTGHYMVQDNNNQNEYTFVGNNGSSWHSWSSKINVEAGAWTHVAFVRQGTRITCYVNGQLAYDDHNDIAATVDNNNGLFTIGGSNGGTGWRGEIDEFANWSRALSASEILNIYVRQNGGDAGSRTPTFAFTPDVAGTYTVQLTSTAEASNPLVETADAIITAISSDGLVLQGKNYQQLLSSYQGNKYQ